MAIFISLFVKCLVDFNTAVLFMERSEMLNTHTHTFVRMCITDLVLELQQNRVK